MNWKILRIIIGIIFLVVVLIAFFNGRQLKQDIDREVSWIDSVLDQAEIPEGLNLSDTCDYLKEDGEKYSHKYDGIAVLLLGFSEDLEAELTDEEKLIILQNAINNIDVLCASQDDEELEIEYI